MDEKELACSYENLIIVGRMCSGCLRGETQFHEVVLTVLESGKAGRIRNEDHLILLKITCS
jgi:hypothetical protein